MRVLECEGKEVVIATNSCVPAAEYRDNVECQCANGASMKLLIDTNQGHDWNENWTKLMIAILNINLRN